LALSASRSFIRTTSLFPHRGIYPNLMFSVYRMGAEEPAALFFLIYL
jgi:hypothetical protein